ncbi:MAG TPA: HisA/HisF-related TIM barrel protein [Candidatus Thermoplasmatota archaeon]|nr:HisA/HisF-related TIM barrel protein [Candidatus Thermoplasmatota archaeon]
MPIEVVPVMQVHQGRLVAASDDLASEDPAKALASLSRAHGRVVVIDQSGLERNEPDLAFIQTASRHASLWLDAGSRDAPDAMDVVVAGAHRATLRWSLLDAPEELDDAVELAEPDTFFLGLEHRNGQFVPNRRDRMPVSALARRADALGIGVVVMDAGGRSFNESLAKSLATAGTERWFAGWVTSERDVAALESLGYTGVLVPAAQARAFAARAKEEGA